MLWPLTLSAAAYGLDFFWVASSILADGQVQASYAAVDGLGEGRVNDFAFR